MNADVKEILEHGDRYFLPHLSIDMVIIGYNNDILQCLLLKMGEKWLLPGGHVRRDQSVDETVINILKARTGLEETFIKFLAVFGDKDRQFKEVMEEFFIKNGMEWKEEYWLNNRFVTLAYYTLVNIAKTHLKIGHFDEAFAWFDFEDLPDMWMDHKSIVQSARKQLKEDIQNKHTSYHLLPEVFTMPDLYRLHQTILGEKIDRSRFQKKMIATGLFERLPELQKNTPGRNPYQYRVKKGR